MSWTQVVGVSLFTTLLILTFSSVVENAALRDDSKADHPKGVAPHVFMPESEASSFFIHRNRRSSEYYAELQAEQTAKPSLSDRRRDNSEEQRNKYDNSVEERRDEPNERSREMPEQVPESYYARMYARSYWLY